MSFIEGEAPVHVTKNAFYACLPSINPKFLAYFDSLTLVIWFNAEWQTMKAELW